MTCVSATGRFPFPNSMIDFLKVRPDAVRRGEGLVEDRRGMPSIAKTVL